MDSNWIMMRPISHRNWNTSKTASEKDPRGEYVEDGVEVVETQGPFHLIISYFLL